MKKNNFFKDFLFGVSTAAYQNEGGNFNSQWYEWEKKGKIDNNQKCGVACNDYKNWGKLVEVLKDLKVQAYRFSVEWSRIEPKEGIFDKEEIEHYRQLIIELKKNHIEPFVSLFHFSIPIWFAEKGGFEREENLVYFERFVKKLADEYKDYVKFWITINEPVIYSFSSYLIGLHPPGKKNILTALKVYKNLILAHVRAYETIKNASKKLKVGLVHQEVIYQPHGSSYILKKITGLISYFSGNLLLKSIAEGRLLFPLSINRKIPKDKIDFIGLNYYYRFCVDYSSKFKTRSGFPFIDYHIPKGSEAAEILGFEIYPEGLYLSLKKASEYRKPIYITESGLDSSDDKKRINYLASHLEQVKRALKEGINVRSYFYWTLCDNFEWTFGYHPKFGLMTRDKKAKKSYLFYRDICRTKKLTSAV